MKQFSCVALFEMEMFRSRKIGNVYLFYAMIYSFNHGDV